MRNKHVNIFIAFFHVILMLFGEDRRSNVSLKTRQIKAERKFRRAQRGISIQDVF